MKTTRTKRLFTLLFFSATISSVVQANSRKTEIQAALQRAIEHNNNIAKPKKDIELPLGVSENPLIEYFTGKLKDCSKPKKDIEWLRMLSLHPVDVGFKKDTNLARTTEKHTAQSYLRKAIKKNDVAKIKNAIGLLGADVNEKGKFFDCTRFAKHGICICVSARALTQAAEYGHTEATKFLLENGGSGDFGSGLAKPMEQAARYGHLEVFKLLLAKQVDENSSAHYTDSLSKSMGLAAKYGHLEVVRLLADKTTGSHCLSRSARSAAKYGHLEVVRLLTDKTTGSHCLATAVKYGHLEIVKLLADKITDSRCLSRSMCSAAKYGHLEVVKLLLARFPWLGLSLF